MDEVDAGQPTSPAAPARAGDRLRAARESAGLSLAEVGARTRIPLRHLEALEVGDYASLPAPTYAMGFSRAYARAVGVDDVGLAEQVRRELDRVPRAPEYVPYETADPTRVPSRGVAVIGLGLALAVLVLVGLWYGTGLFRGHDGGITTTQTTATAPGPAAPQAAAVPVAAAPTGGQVTLTAADEVWLRVYDVANKTLFIGTMKKGDRFDVPATATDPKINVGRPDKLVVTLNGSTVPPLGDGSRPIKDIKVSGPAIAARLTTAPAPAVADNATAP